MNTTSPTSIRKSRMRNAFVLTALAGVVGLCVCMVSSTMGGVLLVTPRVIDAVWLRPLADQLGTEPSKAALVAHVTELLEGQKGSSRTEVYQLLDDVGGFAIRRPSRYRNGESQETAYWTLAELPKGLTIEATWSLRYDVDDRLIDVNLLES